MKKYNKGHINEEYVTKDGYIAKIIDGGSRSEYCTMQIKNFISEVQVSDLKRGAVKYPYHPSVFGKGYFGEGKYRAYVNNKQTPEYKAWTSMLRRCYYKKYTNKYKTYIGCSVSVEWLNFQNFAKWFEENYIKEWHLDKDLLIKGNKVYSPVTCVFIPGCLNLFIANTSSNNTSGYIGVSWNEVNKKWKAQITDCNTHKREYLGCYQTLLEASQIYKRNRTTMAHRMKHKMILDYGITDLRILDAIDKL